MEKQINKGDIASMDAGEGKKVCTVRIAFYGTEDLIERQTIIRTIMKERLPIDLLDAHLIVDGRQVGYGHDLDLLKAEQITLTYTK